jgi:hypothetical protein
VAVGVAGVDGSIICGLVGHLPSLLLGPSALLATPEGTLAPSPASSLKRQQHRSTLQPGMDEKQRAFVRSWVQDNIALLEGVVEGLGTYLGSATAKDLHGVITGFAQIRYVPEGGNVVIAVLSRCCGGITSTMHQASDVRRQLHVLAPSGSTQGPSSCSGTRQPACG